MTQNGITWLIKLCGLRLNINIQIQHFEVFPIHSMCLWQQFRSWYVWQCASNFEENAKYDYSHRKMHKNTMTCGEIDFISSPNHVIWSYNKEITIQLPTVKLSYWLLMVCKNLMANVPIQHDIDSNIMGWMFHDLVLWWTMNRLLLQWMM